jgi:hypothetical protein
MKNFRGMVRLNDLNYLEYFDDSFWWGNREFIFRDDPQLIKHLELKKEDDSKIISYAKDVMENRGQFEMGFEEGSRGFHGFNVKWFSLNETFKYLVKGQEKVAPLEILETKKFGSKEKYFLGSSEYWDIYVNKQVHDYLIGNFSVDLFGENSRDNISYLKDNKLVALVSPFKVLIK